MIATYTFRVRTDADPSEALNEHGARMLRYHKNVLDSHAEAEGGTVLLRVRATGTDRVRLSVAARKYATGLLGAQRLKFERPLVPELVEFEPNGRQLNYGEGRTPRGPYRPRAKRASGTPDPQEAAGAPDGTPTP